MPFKSLPLNFFKFTNSLIPQSFITESNNASASIIFLSLKSPSSFISINKYSRLSFYAKALFAGIVHGVVFQLITSLSFISLIFDDLTGKFT